LLFIDVDDFKKINDTYGHAIGDDALKEIGCILKSSARESDIPARCGGDEFAIMLPNTNNDGAHNTAIRISKTIQHHELIGANNCKLSVSIGHATLIGNNVTSYDALVKLADDAMYKSKSQGKGRVIQA
jgi:diguanylate cyclase (GGDEF)-like protein